MTAGTYSAVKLGRDKRPSTGTVIASAPALPGGRCPPEIEAHWRPGEIVIAWSYDAPPPRRLPEASLAKVRLARLRRRMERKAPLFAAELIQRELDDRPAYYAGKRTTKENDQ